MSVREAAVAGQFYTSDRNALKKQIGEFFSDADAEAHGIKSNAIVTPHAGYIYSGRIAALGYKALEERKTFVILSPNHTGMGESISISNAAEWSTPFGNVKVNTELSGKLAERIGSLDEVAHAGEHSIEVQLPFLQHLFGKNFSIVAVTIATQKLDELKELGSALSELDEKHGLGIIASSDFSHFVPAETAKRLDMEAIEKIKSIGVEEFHQIVMEKGLSICGMSAITALMQYCREKKFDRGELLGYDTSASASGDKMSVVGYAALAFV